MVKDSVSDQSKMSNNNNNDDHHHSGVLHRIVPVSVIFHSDGEVCPLSRGEKACPLEDKDLGRPYFGDNDSSWDQLGQVPNLRKLAGCFEIAQRLNQIQGKNGLRLPPEVMTWDDNEPIRLLPNPGEEEAVHPLPTTASANNHKDYPPPPSSLQPPSGSSVVSTSHRTDSGVGDSLEGTGTTYSGARLPLMEDGGFDEYEDELSPELMMDEDEQDNDGGDVIKSLPDRTELRKYEKKKRIGLQFLSNVTAQQIAEMSPTLKHSMEHFINQLESHSDEVSLWQGQICINPVSCDALGVRACKHDMEENSNS